jgi:hypothetical protein
MKKLILLVTATAGLLVGCSPQSGDDGSTTGAGTTAGDTTAGTNAAATPGASTNTNNAATGASH